MQKSVLYTVLIVLISNIGFSQIQFEISYSTGRNDQARAIVQTFDDGYAVIGSTENYDGNTDVYLMKVDVNGSFLWAKRYGGYGMDGGEDIIQTPDSGFAIVGYGQPNNNYDVFFIRTDKNGDTLYTRYFGGNDWDLGYSIQFTSDNGFLLAGETHDAGNSKGYLIKLNSKGKTIWTKTFGGNGLDKFEDVIITMADEYLMAGETSSFGNNRQAYLVKTDTAGNITWEKNYGAPGINFAKSVCELPTGHFIVAGGTNTLPSPDIDNWGFRINSIGNFIDHDVVEDYMSTNPIDQNDDWHQVVIPQKDSLIFGGKRSYENFEPGNIYIRRFKQTTLNSPGYINDYQKLMSAGEDIVYDAKITSDNGVIFACTGERMDTSAASIYLIKMDSTMKYPHPFYNSVSLTNDFTAIDESEEVKEFIVYPNPNSGIVSLKVLGVDTEKEIIIHNLNGTLIRKEKMNNEFKTMDLTQFNTGVYLITVNSENFSSTKKLVISK